MGFWDSFDDEMERSGSDTRINRQTRRYDSSCNVQDDSGTAQNYLLEENCDDEEIDSTDNVDSEIDPYLLAGNIAMAECDFATAVDSYMKALSNGNLDALVVMSDAMVSLVLCNAPSWGYTIGHDETRDYILECAFTFYIFATLLPNTEQVAEEHLEILLSRCTKCPELDEMLERISGRISGRIMNNPFAFVKSMLSFFTKQQKKEML